MSNISLEELNQIKEDINSDNLKRYRVVIDLTLNTKICDEPDQWDWNELLDLSSEESINDVFVEEFDEMYY